MGRYRRLPGPLGALFALFACHLFALLPFSCCRPSSLDLSLAAPPARPTPTPTCNAPTAYALASLHALLAWARARRAPIECAWDDADGGADGADGSRKTLLLEDPTVVAVGNGRFFGGGLQICPRADTGDGALRATSAAGFGALRFVRSAARLRAGRLEGIAGVKTFCFRRRLEVRPAAAAAEEEEEAREGGGHPLPSLLWEADGEPIGAGAAAVTLVPGALRLCA